MLKRTVLGAGGYLRSKHFYAILMVGGRPFTMRFGKRWHSGPVAAIFHDRPTVPHRDPRMLHD